MLWCHLRVANTSTGGAKPHVTRVAVMVYLPAEVIAWIDAKATARFKRRATHLADWIISAYEREQTK